MTVPHPGTEAPPAILAMRDVWKSFGGAFALRGAEIFLHYAEIHALLGENGAGKSTLINIATGVHQPDSGTVSIRGETLKLANPKAALERGVAVVHQERNLVAKFSVAENLFLGRPAVVAGLVSYRRMAVDAGPWLERVGLDVDPLTEAGRLRPGQAQLLEIAKALAQRCEILILDEPTSALTEAETLQLLAVIRSLRSEGTSVVFVSHKLEESYALCDRVTVLRDGKNVVSGQRLVTVKPGEIIRAMVGREVEASAPAKRTVEPGGHPRLQLVNVSTEYGHRNIELTVRVGEIVGLYGIVGAGRTELARCLVGLGRITGGEMRIDGKPARVRNPFDALRNHAIGYVSEDRKGEGLILAHSISRNIGITIWDRVKGRLGWLSERRALVTVERLARLVGVKMQSLGQSTGSLSGGNQQKVSVAKWLAAEVDLLILDEPTTGVDVVAKDELHRLMRTLAEEGMALLLISSDLREVIQLADRIVIMGRFRLLAEIDNSHDYAEVSEAIMSHISGAPGRGS